MPFVIDRAILCYRKKNQESYNSSEKSSGDKPQKVGLTTIKSNTDLDQGSDNVVLPENNKEGNMDINKKYRPFVSEGCVSLCSGDISQYQFKF